MNFLFSPLVIILCSIQNEATLKNVGVKFGCKSYFSKMNEKILLTSAANTLTSIYEIYF